MPGYLDTVSSEPLSPRARETLLAAYDAGWADPLRLHRSAREARMLLDNARAATAEALGTRPDEVSFTGSGTQAVHLGVLGLLGGHRGASHHLAHTAVEHSAVFAAARWSEAETTSLPVGLDGRVDVAAVTELVSARPAVLAVQQANPEVGTLQPLEEIGRAAAGHDVPLFVDACAVAARLPLPARWDVAALSAHKWGGPAGLGVLLVRHGTRWRAPFPTDDRVDHRVAGFENVPAALAAAAALQERVSARETLNAAHAELADRLRRRLADVEDVDVHGPTDPVDRMPHLVSFSFLYVEGDVLVEALARRGWSVASGSACTASVLEPSHVLVAMGALSHGNVRVSFESTTTPAEVDRFADDLVDVVATLRAGLR